MGSLRNPVGSLPSTVYWRRRVLVLLAVLVVLALILYACSGSGSGKKSPVGAGKNSTPAASQTSIPASGGSSAQASGGPTGGAPGTSNAPASSGGAPSGSSAGAPSGSAGGPTGGTGGTTGGQNPGQTGQTGQNPGATGCQLSLLLSSQSPQYAQGDHPSFTVTALNKGTADCDVDLGPKSLVLNIYSGQDKIWSSADCATGGADIRGIAPGTAQNIPYTWDRIRSSAGCPGGGQLAKLGMYFGVVNLAAGTGPTATAVQSQPKTFELKSGS